MEGVKIKTVEDAILYTGRDLSILEALKLLPEKDREHFEADYSLKIIVEALNKEANGGEDWKPDFNDKSDNRTLSAFICNDENGTCKLRLIHTFDALTIGNAQLRYTLKSNEVFKRLKEDFSHLINSVWTK